MREDANQTRAQLSSPRVAHLFSQLRHLLLSLLQRCVVGVDVRGELGVRCCVLMGAIHLSAHGSVCHDICAASRLATFNAYMYRSPKLVPAQNRRMQRVSCLLARTAEMVAVSSTRLQSVVPSCLEAALQFC